MAEELDVGGIVMKIRADVSGVQAGVNQMSAALAQMRAASDQAGAKVEESSAKEVDAVKKAASASTQAAGDIKNANNQMGQSAESASAEMTVAYAAAAAAAYKMISIITNAVQTGIDEMNRYKAAVLGLSSVASGKNISTGDMTGALNQLTDAFFDASAAATSLKNLLSRGYTLDQAVQTITRLKDAAAFGRQASLGLAQAVQSATEGLKNENSILVDNSGVTKNVSVMWAEYAKQIGVSVAALTTSQKIQAEYNGIMRETQYQAGDLAKLTQTLAGAQAEAAMSGTLLARAYGEEMTPAVSAITSVWNDFVGGLKTATEATPGLASGLTATAVGLAGLTIASKGALALQALAKAFHTATAGATGFAAAINTALPWLAAIAVAIGVATMAYTSIKNTEEAAAEAAEAMAQAQKEELQAAKDSVTALGTMEDRYKTLINKKHLSYTETKELKALETSLAAQYGINVTELASLETAYGSILGAISAKRIEQQKELQTQLDLNVATAEATQAAAALALEEAKAKREAAQAEYDTVSNGDQSLGGRLRDALYTTTYGVREISRTTTDLNEAIKGEEAAIFANMTAMMETLKARMAAAANAIETSGIQINSVVKDMVDGLYESLLTDYPDVDTSGLIDSYTEALQNADVAPAITALKEMEAKFLAGTSLTDADKEAYKTAWLDLQDFMASVVGSFTDDSGALTAKLYAMVPLIQAYGGDMEDLSTMLEDLYAAWPQAQLDEFLSLDAASMQTNIDAIATKATEAGTSFKSLGERLGETSLAIQALQTLQNAWGNQTSQTFKDAAAAVLEYTGFEITSMEQLTELMESYSVIASGQMDEQRAAYETYAQIVSELVSKRDALIAEYGEESAEAKQLTIVITNLALALQLMQQSSGQTLDIGLSVDTTGYDTMLAKIEEVKTSIENTGDALTALSIKKDTIDNVLKLVAAAKKAEAAGQSVSDTWRSQVSAVLGEEFTGTLDAAEAALQQLAVGTSGAYKSLADELNAYEQAIQASLADAEYQMAINPSVKVNTAPLIAALSIINAFRKALGLKTISTGGGSGGTSAYQKDIDALEHQIDMDTVSLEQQLSALEALQAKYTNRKGKSTLSLTDSRDLEKRLYDAQQAIREEDLQDAYDLLDHKKAIGELTLAQEIAGLEAIKAARALTADELADIEERLCDTRAQLLDNEYQAEIASVDHAKAMGQMTVDQELAALQAILDAHELTADRINEITERMYSLQVEQQQEALASQTDAITTAYDAITAALKNQLQEGKDAELDALDAKIQALNDAADAEDEAARVAEYQENLADLQAQLRREKSARKKRELQEEIDALILSESERQADLLRQAEIDALKEQKTAVTDKYTELMSEENLRQEALRLVMSNNLQAMSDLIASYGEEWSNAGAMLAEQLTSGLLSGSGSIVTTIQSIIDQMNASLQLQIAGAASAGSAINKAALTININNPIVKENADLDALGRQIADAIDAAGR